MGQAFSGVKKGSRLLLAGILLVAVPLTANAVGLGRLKVKSALNEPLNAEIPLTDVSRRDVRSLEAGLAPRSAFEALGIDRPASLSNIKFTISKRLDGTYFIQLTTRQPYAEPFLHMLVQLEWAGGRLSREYTALIDPPYLSSARPSSITAPRLQTPAEDYEPLPEPLKDESLSESSSAQDQAAQTMPAPMSSLPAPLPEEPKLIGKSDGTSQAATTAKAEPTPEPAMPEPITSSDSSKDQGKSIDQIEAETFGAKESSIPKEPEVVSAAPSATVEPMPEPMTQASNEPSEPDMQAFDDRSGLLGPPNVPIIPVEPEQMQKAAAFWAESDQYKVKRGDTLYEIAQHLRKDSSVTLNQVMMALYEANPRAFYDNNVNNLRAGRILQVPEIGTVKNKSVSSANREFKVQYDAWQEHKIMMAQAKNPVKVESEPAPMEKPAKTAKTSTPESSNAATAKQQADAKAKQQAAAKAKREAEQKRIANANAKKAADAQAKKQAEQKRLADAKAKQQAAKNHQALAASKTAKAKQTEELLRIVRASMLMAPTNGATPETESTQGAKEQQALAKRMDNLAESAESQNLKNQEMANKAGKIQQNIESEKRLIEVENPSLAQTKPAQPAAKPANNTATKKPAPSKKPIQVAKNSKPAHARIPPKPKEVSIVDTILETLLGNQFVLMAIGGVVLLGVAIMAIYMKRRRKSLADFEESILSADSATDDLSTDSQEDLGSESGDTSFLSDFSQEGMGNIATDEVDPIAEADVYLAYGRDEQAEEILKDAVSKHPDRAELKLKLLEIYHQRNDVSGFETLAEELYASGNAGSVWSQVADMGAQLNPDNPMFKGDAPPAGMMGGATPPPPAEPMMGGDLDMTEMVPGNASLDDGSGMDDSLDFDIEGPAGGGETELVSAPGSDDDLSMDFNMDAGGLDTGTSVEEEPAMETEGDEGDFALDFNMDTADFSEEASGDSGAAPAAGGEDTGLDFNMDFEDLGGGAESEESELSMDSDDGLSLDMESEDDTGLEFDSGDFNMESSEDELDMSSMSMEEEEDSGLSALDMVKASGGGLPENEDGSLNFSLSSDSDDEELSFGEDEDSGLDMSGDFGMDTSGGATDVAEAVDVSEAVGTADADVDSDDNWDEAATKLDLAKAYIDMGDADGAKSILDEVMAEGNAEQKAQASELAAQI